jgi:hypothetical protein
MIAILLWLLAAVAASAQSPVRPRAIQDPVVIYNNWSAYDELSDNVELTEPLAMRQLEEMLRLRRAGARFDYYMNDAYWFARDGGYRTWRKPHWPNGPDAWLKKCLDNGVRPGLWIGTNTLSGLAAIPEWRDSLNRQGTAMCLFRGGFLPHLMGSLQYWHDRGVRAFKFDFADFSAATPEVEATHAPEQIRALNEATFRAALVSFREKNPGVVLLGYNGFGGDMESTSTPFRKNVDERWLEAFDSLYCGDPRPADVPAMNFWRSMDIYTDHQVRRYEASRFPLERIDSSSFMIGVTGTCLRRGKAGWKGLLLLSLAHGGWINMLYGNLEQLDDRDAAWLARAGQVFLRLQALGRIRSFGGVPGEGAGYGFAAASDRGALYTVVNPAQRVASIELPRVSAAQPPLAAGRVKFRDAGFEPVLAGVRVTLGPEQMAVVGFGEYAGASYDLGVQEDVVIPRAIAPLEARFAPAGRNAIAATVDPPAGAALRIVLRQFHADGSVFRSSRGAPPNGTTLAKVLSLEAEQDGAPCPIEIRYDKAIWSGLSWAAGEIRAQDLKPGRPVTVRLRSAEPQDVVLKGELYRVE